MIRGIGVVQESPLILRLLVIIQISRKSNRSWDQGKYLDGESWKTGNDEKGRYYRGGNHHRDIHSNESAWQKMMMKAKDYASVPNFLGPLSYNVLHSELPKKPPTFLRKHCERRPNFSIDNIILALHSLDNGENHVILVQFEVPCWSSKNGVIR